MQIRSKFAVVSLLAVVACGDEGDGGGGGTGGVSGSKKIGDLSAAETRSVCKSIATKSGKIIDANTELFCVLTGLGLGSEASCNASVDECKDDNGFGEDLSADCDGAEAGDTGLSTECDDLTVSELNACLDAAVKAFDGIAAKVSCSSEEDEVAQLQADYKVPKACEDLADKCPELAEMGTAP